MTDLYTGLSPYNYCGNNPVSNVDPDGRWFDTFLGIAFVAYDVGKLAYDKVTTGKTHSDDWYALGADLACAVVPFATGGGVATRMASKADEAVDIAKTVEKVGEKTYQTYTKTNSKTGEIYSGRTSGTGTPEKNVQKRDANHHLKKEDGWGPAGLDKSSKNKDAIRGREQQLINKNGGAKSTGGKSGNKINGVSKTNKKAKKYDEAARKEFGNP